MVNQQKIGRYEVVSVMGQGAMGTVYKATDPVIERTVAIKTINLDLSAEERAEFEERFYREAKSAGRLNHPNIVTIYDVGETGNAAYIAMEYIEGETLREMLDSGVVLTMKRICQIAAHVAVALHYAHKNGVVHRDIKPANIMISRNRDVKIMDFGIALIPTGSRTLAGTVLGSPKYMAPEQVAGKPTDGRADIFSLGVVLYEMLTGSTPFNGDNLTAIMYKILNEEPAPPSTLNARVPKAFDSVVAKALAKRPEDRYQTAKEFARELYKYEVLVSPETDQAAAGGPDTTVMQKPLPAVSRRQAADSFGVKTEILLPPPPSMQPKPPPTPAPRTARRLALLALPLLALAAYLFLRPEQPSLAPALLARTPAEMPADNAEPGQPSARQAGADPAPAPVANASLSFAVTPWGEVFIDGRKAGITPPLTRLELPPGQHSIEIRNSAYAPYHVKVDLDSSETLKIKHKFK